ADGVRVLIRIRGGVEVSPDTVGGWIRDHHWRHLGNTTPAEYLENFEESNCNVNKALHFDFEQRIYTALKYGDWDIEPGHAPFHITRVAFVELWGEWFRTLMAASKRVKYERMHHD